MDDSFIQNDSMITKNKDELGMIINSNYLPSPIKSNIINKNNNQTQLSERNILINILLAFDDQQTTKQELLPLKTNKNKDKNIITNRYISSNIKEKINKMILENNKTVSPCKTPFYFNSSPKYPYTIIHNIKSNEKR